MQFAELPRVFPDQPLWGAVSRNFTFIISQDEPGGFTASVKAHPFDRTRHDLGGFCAHKSFEAAKEACKKFLRERN
jgi:hypothetical protein